MSKTGKTIKVEQIGSPIRRQHDQRETLIGLGLNRSAASRELPDTPAMRGMIAKVAHLVRVVDGSDAIGRGERGCDEAQRTRRPGRARARSACASAAASAPARARPAAAAARARPRARACASRASRAARCRCTGACPSAASTTSVRAEAQRGQPRPGAGGDRRRQARCRRHGRRRRRWSRPACCGAPRTASGSSARASSRPR